MAAATEEKTILSEKANPANGDDDTTSPVSNNNIIYLHVPPLLPLSVFVMRLIRRPPSPSPSYPYKTSSHTQHKLQNRWTLYYLNPNKTAYTSISSTTSWLEQLNNIYTFDTVEDFWA